MTKKIAVYCTACAATLAVPKSAQGKNVRCPKCSAVISVPQQEDSERGQSRTGLNDGVPVVQARWDTDDPYDADWSMDEYGDANWATDKDSQSPPPLSAINDNGSKALGGAEDSKNREDPGEQSGKRGKRKQQREIRQLM